MIFVCFFEITNCVWFSVNVERRAQERFLIEIDIGTRTTPSARTRDGDKKSVHERAFYGSSINSTIAIDNSRKIRYHSSRPAASRTDRFIDNLLVRQFVRVLKSLLPNCDLFVERKKIRAWADNLKQLWNINRRYKLSYIIMQMNSYVCIEINK